MPPLPPVIHPLLVHFTIGLVPAATAFALWTAWKGTDWTRRATYALLTASAILTLATMGSGFREYFQLAPRLEGTARDVLEWHERLGVISTIVLGATTSIAWWRRRDVATRSGWRWALAIALAATSLLIMIAAWYGGSLVYDHGAASAGALAEG